jgi:aryl-alcohol dehydrogenase-like predicted oxidoreductase
VKTQTLTRSLGRSGIEVSAVGLGCWAIGGPFFRDGGPVGWGEVDDAESVRAIHRALDLGATFFDTSNVYGAGHSERVLGRALAGRRDEVVIATKFGNVFDESTRHITGADASPDGIRRACEVSLRRLRTDRIDLYQLHLGDYDPVAAAEVRETLEALVADGSIRAYGWSTDDPERARVFAEGEHCAAVQHQLNVLDDAPDMLALCDERGLASVNRGPLAMGLLTGKFAVDSRVAADDVRGEHGPPWMKYFRGGQPAPEWLERLEAVREVLAGGGRGLAVGALAWLLARSHRTIPIPGFRTAAQVEENLRVLEHGPLPATEFAEVERLLGR